MITQAKHEASLRRIAICIVGDMLGEIYRHLFLCAGIPIAYQRMCVTMNKNLHAVLIYEGPSCALYNGIDKALQFLDEFFEETGI